MGRQRPGAAGVRWLADPGRHHARRPGWPGTPHLPGSPSYADQRTGRRPARRCGAAGQRPGPGPGCHSQARRRSRRRCGAASLRAWTRTRTSGLTRATEQKSAPGMSNRYSSRPWARHLQLCKNRPTGGPPAQKRDVSCPYSRSTWWRPACASALAGLRVRPVDEAALAKGAERCRHRALLAGSMALTGVFTGLLANGGGS
jgi:hypothetical protein